MLRSERSPPPEKGPTRDTETPRERPQRVPDAPERRTGGPTSRGGLRAPRDCPGVRAGLVGAGVSALYPQLVLDDALGAVTCDENCPHGPAIHRDGWTRPVVDGQPLTRISTLAGTLEDSYGLVGWKARMTLLGATETHLRQARTHDPTTKEGREALAAVVEDSVTRAGAGDAATEGTMMHAVLTDAAMALPGEYDTSKLDTGQSAMLEAFTAEMDRLGLRAFMAEQFVKTDEYAGTFDLGIVDPHGRHWMTDIKTGAKEWDVRKPGKVAIQLAAYAAGKRWCPTNGDLFTPEWHGLMLISVPLNQGRASIHIVNYDRAREGLALARTVRAWRKDQNGLAAPAIATQEGK